MTGQPPTFDELRASPSSVMRLMTSSCTLVHGATTFSDYFELLKDNVEWQIANKVYSSRPTK